ncbi:MAG: SBBP repeat-containing protein [Acidobacteria bacterium]|nr:SBBP repeat-containing protein [Acidobacteriota bacterium]
MGKISFSKLLVFLFVTLVSQLVLPTGLTQSSNLVNNKIFIPKTLLNTDNNSNYLAKLGLKPASRETISKINENYGKLPLRFEKNVGQTNQSIDFISHNNNYTLFLSSTKATFAFENERNINNFINKSKVYNENDKVSITNILTMRLVKANSYAKAIELEQLETVSNYLLSNDKKQWKSNVQNFAKVKYQNIYPGIDIVYYGNQRQLEYDLIVSPYADPKNINLEFVEANTLTVNSNGDLIIIVNDQEIYKKKPYAYQEINGIRQIIDSKYVVKENKMVSFELSDYDASQPLIIDPMVGYSTYLGGTGSDFSNAIAIDNTGNAYIVGYTESTNFPTNNPQQRTLSGKNDIFVSKLNASGNSLAFSTYIGGSDEDFGNAIAIDSKSNVYITGYTFSTNFPTVNALQSKNGNTTSNSGGDSFVVKLNSQGNSLIYATYVGGASDDMATSIAVDSQDSAYITGFTNSANFPVANAIQNKSNGGFDAFLTKLSSIGNSLIYSTYFGGSDNDFGNAIAIDKNNNVYIVGQTDSRNLPTVNPQQSIIGGDSDGFITKFTNTGNTISFATYFGGSDFDVITSIAIDNINNIYVTGVTASKDLSVMSALQQNKADNLDIFISKLNAIGNSLIFSTYLGGNGDEQANSIGLDEKNNVYIMGVTTSTNFPLIDAIQKTNAGGQDAFMTKLNATGNSLIFSTYLGGAGNDVGASLAVDPKGNVFMTGITNSMNFPMSKPLQSACGCDPSKKISDGFVVGFFETAPPPPTPDFSISLAQAQVNLARGKQVDININITRTGGFTGSITITPDLDRAKTLKLTFTPTSQSTTAAITTFSLKAKKKALVGTSPIIFTAKDSNGKIKTATLTLIIQ